MSSITTLSMKEYRELPAYSFHDINVLVGQSPAHFKNREKVETTDAMRMGSLFHALMDGSTFHVVEASDKRSKAGKAAWDQYGGGFEPFATADEIDEARQWQRAILATKSGRWLFDAPGYVEASLRFEYKGLAFKARPDKITSSGILIDWKTCADANPVKFKRTITDFGYHRQLWFYTLAARQCGLRVDTACLVPVEKASPHATYVAELSADLLKLGEVEMEKAIDKLKACLDSGNFPSYAADDGDDIITFTLNEWEYRKAFGIRG